MIEKLIILIFCHTLGDYVLQNDFLARTKGDNWYHLVVHCFLYVFPFFVYFGFDWRLVLLFFTHVIIDALKAKYKKINYATDQILHYLVASIYLL